MVHPRPRVPVEVIVDGTAHVLQVGAPLFAPVGRSLPDSAYAATQDLVHRLGLEPSLADKWSTRIEAKAAEAQMQSIFNNRTVFPGAALVPSDARLVRIGGLASTGAFSLELNVSRGIASAPTSACFSLNLGYDLCVALAAQVDAAVKAAETNSCASQHSSCWFALWKAQDEGQWVTCEIEDRLHEGLGVVAGPRGVHFLGPEENCLSQVPPLLRFMALLQVETDTLVSNKDDVTFSALDDAPGLSALEIRLAMAVKKSFLAAASSYTEPEVEQAQHRLVESEFVMEGFSGSANRVVMNVLASEVGSAHAESGGVRYLEVGSYLGSSLAAAVCGNALSLAVSVDDFSEFGGSSDTLRDRVRDCESRAVWATGSGGGVQFIKGRFQDQTVLRSLASFPRFHLYLYDGPHGEQDHFDALFLIAPVAMGSVYVVVVDDW